ncbi:hypothetical protein P0Y67_14740 [Photobacterium sp. SP02]|uniref:hypothetical protein n=1 Tax=Photobacterium sp. SP02 TaxID=3032280 RepID=UPI0031455B75
MKKKLLAYSVGALCVGAIAYPAWKMIKEKIAYDKDYQEQLNLIVEAIEIRRWNTKSDPADWNINIIIPEEPEYETWDDNYSLPRLLFRAIKKGERDFNLYSMNLDGTDIKIIATDEEFGGNVAPFGVVKKPSRSPDGRFIISTAFNKGYYCALYDIKERESYKLAPNPCYIESWVSDGSSVLINNSGKTGLLSLTDRSFEYLKDIYGYQFDDVNNRFFLLNDKQIAISKVYKNNDFLKSIPGDGNQIVYEMPGFKKPVRENYLTEECELGGFFGMTVNYFTCNFKPNQSTYNIYDSRNPNEVIGESYGFWVIEPGVWAIQKGIVYRVKRDNEDSDIKKMRYTYDAGKEHELIVYDDLYVSKNLKYNIDSIDITSYMPKLPSKKQYEETLLNLLYK